MNQCIKLITHRVTISKQKSLGGIAFNMHQCIINSASIKSEDFAARVAARILFSSPFMREIPRPQNPCPRPTPDPLFDPLPPRPPNTPQNTLNNRYLNMLAPYVYIRHN